MPIQVRAPRQKGANAISPGNVTDPQITPKAPQVQESIRTANPSEGKQQVGKEACALLHIFKPSSPHKERDCLALKSCVRDHLQQVYRAPFLTAAARKHEERAPNTGLERSISSAVKITEGQQKGWCSSHGRPRVGAKVRDATTATLTRSGQAQT